MFLEHVSSIGRLFGSKSPVHIPDLVTYLELNYAEKLNKSVHPN
jgi:hypothetical protein